MLTKNDRRSIKSTAAILLTLFYIINVQSVDEDVPKQMARQDELEITVQNTKKQLAY